jgi:selenophosphate synthetase-related protein
MSELQKLAAKIRSSPAVQAKRDLVVVRRLGTSFDGDDAAAIPNGDQYLILCGEATAPALVSANPRSAGAAAVVTNVSDVRAMGGRPIGIVDMLVSPDRSHAEAVLEGIAWAARLLDVKVVGGHTTLGHSPSLAASCTGIARRPLFSRNGRPGDALLAAFSLEGRYVEETLFFSSLRDRTPEQLRDDGEALVELAESDVAHAARDVSMPGTVGSLLQLLETAGCGARLELERIPRPRDVSLERWLLTFPSFGFVVAAPPERAAEAAEPFLRRGLACSRCGQLDDTGTLTLTASGETADVWRLASEPFTHLTGD